MSLNDIHVFVVLVVHHSSHGLVHQTLKPKQPVTSTIVALVGRWSVIHAPKIKHQYPRLVLLRVLEFVIVAIMGGARSTMTCASIKTTVLTQVRMIIILLRIKAL